MWIPGEKGSYALELVVPQQAHLSIGKLGEFQFPAGRYIYLGSAQNPGGLQARLTRHLIPLKSGKLHWHIDYLRRVSKPAAVCFLTHRAADYAGLPLECRWSKLFTRQPDSAIPAAGFGASDCSSGCEAHLFLFDRPRFDPILSDWGLRQRMADVAGVDPEMLCLHLLTPGVK
jgi:Uri superfamily endonuclease